MRDVRREERERGCDCGCCFRPKAVVVVVAAVPVHAWESERREGEESVSIGLKDESTLQS